MSGAEVRNHILNSAGPVFAERGYRGATVREICAAASVNVAAVSYYFGDKSQLYVETVKRAHQLRVADVPWRDCEDATATERLRAFIATLMERMVGQRGATWPARLMLREVLNPTEACRGLVEDYFRPQTQLLLSILDKLIPPEVPAARRYQIAFSIIGQCLFYRTAGDVIPMLIGEQPFQENFQTYELADHITDLACAALENLPAHWSPSFPLTK